MKRALETLMVAAALAALACGGAPEPVAEEAEDTAAAAARIAAGGAWARVARTRKSP